MASMLILPPIRSNFFFSIKITRFLSNRDLKKVAAWPKIMAGPLKSEKRAFEPEVSNMEEKAPILLFDVMDTLVRDPFYEDVPAYFGLSLKELISIKHPTAWLEFEKGNINEDELKMKFFADGRDFDFDGLKNCMLAGYEYLEGIEELLQRLKLAGYRMHAFSNYPAWYAMIEEKLKLSQYLSWTFVSCNSGLRKPDQEAFLKAADHFQLHPSNFIFIDDQINNVETAIQVGMVGIHFKHAKGLEADFCAQGLLL